MSLTRNQLLNKKRRLSPDEKRAAKGGRITPQPFFSGTCKSVFTTTPKKPNSAQRKVAKVKLSNGIEVNTYIPGIKHAFQESSKVLVRYGSRRDLIGYKFIIVRRNESAVAERRNGRSRYGTKKPQEAGA